MEKNAYYQMMMVMLYLLSMIQNCTFQLLLCEKKIIKIFIEQQNKGLQRSIYWNEYKTKEQTEDANANVTKYINLDPSFQGVNRLFIMEYNRLAAANDNQFNKDSQQIYYLPRNDLNKYNVIIDGRNFYDSDIEKYRELKKVMIVKEKIILQGPCWIIITLKSIIN